MSMAMDERIAEKVMGWTPSFHMERVPEFSTNIGCAWLVVEKLRADGWRVMIYSIGKQRWDVRLFKGDARPLGFGSEITIAICAAALEAVDS